MPLFALLWPLVLPHGAVDVAGTVEVNLAVRQVAQPWSIAPDAWWGVTDRLTLGVITSGRALPRIQVGDGFCVTGTAHGCPRVYDNAGFDMRYALRRGTFEAAARMRLVARSFSPFKPSWRPGALLRWHRGPIAVEADPQFWFGLANEDRGNANELEIPITVRGDLGSHAELWFTTGARGEIDGFTEKFAIPIAGGAAVRWRGWDAGAEVGMPEALGPQNTINFRSMYVFVETRVR